MNLILFILFFVGVYSYAYIKKMLDKQKPSKASDYFDLNEKYLSRNRRIESVKILRLYSEIDIIIIRSLLDSAKINSYVEFPNLNSLYAGIAIQGYSDCYMFVEKYCVYDALRIIKPYIIFNRKTNKKNYKFDPRQLCEFILGSYCVPNGRNRNLPELLL